MFITERLFIRFPQESDAQILKHFEEKNREQLKQWAGAGEIVIGDQWRQQLAVWRDDFDKERAIRFFVFAKESKSSLISIVNYTNIVRGLLQSTHLGYYSDYEFASVGLIAEALEVTMAYIFQYYMLHRIIATYQPQNISVAHILKALGFRVEGYAYDYLLTQAGWQDHILTALINTDWQAKRINNVFYNTQID